MSIKITKDRVPDILKAVRALTKQDVFVGIPASAADRDDGGPVNNAQIGYLNETGSPSSNIPPRPHLVPGIKSVQDKIANQLKAAATLALEGARNDVMKQFGKAGLTAQAAVRKKITDGLTPPLSDVTIQRRRNRSVAPRTGTKPLIDTSNYIQHITYVIREKTK